MGQRGGENRPGAKSSTVVAPEVTQTALSGKAFELRGHLVMLAADVAEIFTVETREIVQNIKSNAEIFPERYAFQLTAEEVDCLRSAALISKPGRGGSRALPWAVTRKGTLRLATIMKSPRAIEATDIFIDVFDEVLDQLQAGRREIILTNLPNALASGADGDLLKKVKGQLADAVSKLLATTTEPEGTATVADELRAVSTATIDHLKAWLQNKSINNEKIAAETVLLLEQAQDIYERRRADLADRQLDRERKTLENLQLRIQAVRDVMSLLGEIEPSPVIDMARRFASPVSGTQRRHLDRPEGGENSE